MVIILHLIWFQQLWYYRKNGAFKYVGGVMARSYLQGWRALFLKKRVLQIGGEWTNKSEVGLFVFSASSEEEATMRYPILWGLSLKEPD